MYCMGEKDRGGRPAAVSCRWAMGLCCFDDIVGDTYEANDIARYAPMAGGRIRIRPIETDRLDFRRGGCESQEYGCFLRS